MFITWWRGRRRSKRGHRSKWPASSCRHTPPLVARRWHNIARTRSLKWWGRWHGPRSALQMAQLYLKRKWMNRRGFAVFTLDEWLNIWIRNLIRKWMMMDWKLNGMKSHLISFMGIEQSQSKHNQPQRLIYPQVVNGHSIYQFSTLLLFTAPSSSGDRRRVHK